MLIQSSSLLILSCNVIISLPICQYKQEQVLGIGSGSSDNEFEYNDDDTDEDEEEQEEDGGKDEEGEDDDELFMDDDIEDEYEERLADDRAWGNKKWRYIGTDTSDERIQSKLNAREINLVMEWTNIDEYSVSKDVYKMR